MAHLSVESLCVRYPNGAIGVEDVSLEAAAGTVAVIFGPNGAGKTTTVRAITGFLRGEGARALRGCVRLDDRDITGVEPHQACALGIAFVPERQKIFPNLSVQENLAAIWKLPPRGRREQLYSQIYGLFPILETRARKLAGHLSGGEQQMLAIARALMHEPRVLVIDEITLGLHDSVHPVLFEVVKTIAQEGTAVIVVDESTSVALTVADHCYLLGGGEVKMSGPPEAFAGNELLAAGYVEES